jgi:formylglycine-generating enzyme required for sulfatase activity/uncharacterized protein YbaR (Trm112 family)
MDDSAGQPAGYLVSNQHRPSIFLSYTRRDDEYERGALSALRERLEAALHFASGEPIDIFQDVEHIKLGQGIRQRIEESLDEAMVFVPIITPSYLNSRWCRDELERFLKREQQLGRSDLILPIYYQRVPALERARQGPQAASTATDVLVREMAPRLSVDWRDLRSKGLESQEVRNELERIAERIIELLEELEQAPPPPPPPEPEPGPKRSLSPALLDILADPGDKGKLELIEDAAGNEWLLNPRNGYCYPVEDGIPNLSLEEGEQHRDERLIRPPEPEPAPAPEPPRSAELLRTLRDPQQPTSARIQAGFALGEQGDPRFPVSLDEWREELERLQPEQSDGYLCYVPAGTYTIGSDNDDPDAQDNETPQYRTHLKHDVWIARYPITNAQWREWVSAGGVPSRYADKAAFNQPNQPVVGVSWEECRDFCRWLTRALPLPIPIRLPSEAEWEAAARSPRGWRYTWGYEWRADRAASSEDREERGTQAPAPVGCYPLGASRFCGALDMLGNVWEWTGSSWTDNSLSQQAMLLSDDARQYTVKGGSFRTRPALVRCAARSPASRDARDPDLGFRVVVEAPQDEPRPI